ncbi:MAG: hypothetical protein IJV40_13095 [Oscillospiraceae bacterium]|nr:hypothetical protein [Oscillospiraceae bacterium]
MTLLGKKLHTAILVLMCGILLLGCGRVQEISPEPEEVQTEEEAGPPTWEQRYVSDSATVAEEKEAVLFQQSCEGGFLAYINRKVRENIPAELKEDPNFVNNGRFDVYESALFRVTKSGKRDKVRRYRPLPAPEKPEDLENYFSESRPRAFRVRENGEIVALESSYESWLTGQRYQYRDRYYVRVLKPNGVEISNCEIETEPGLGLNCEYAVYLGEDRMAVPQGQEVLVFGMDGKKLFSVSAPFPIREMCAMGDGALAVVLADGDQLWVSTIRISDLSVTVPQRAPDGAHSFCPSGEDDRKLCFLRNSEVFCYDTVSGESEKLVSLLSIGVEPTSVGAFFTGNDGSLHFLLHMSTGTETVQENYLIAAPQTKETERLLLTLGFTDISDSLAERIIAFNRVSRTAFLEAVDYRNEPEGALFSAPLDLAAVNEEGYERLQAQNRLADLRGLLEADSKYQETDLFHSVLNALTDETGAMRRLAGRFRIETMACDWKTVEGNSVQSMDALRAIYSEMPAGSILYEPYYTSGRLMEDLSRVNRQSLGSGENFNAELFTKLKNFANLQPEAYSYNSYTADPGSMEGRIYSGKLLMMQAHIGSLDELKWYDAFFESGACFAGWPMEEGSASQLRFDENLVVSAACTEEQQKAAWTFLRTLLSPEYTADGYGFPVVAETLKERMAADAAAVSYRLDEKGKFELDKNGNKIEIARDSWYSPDWRRHFVYALTETQQQKLLTLIEHSV